MTGDPFEAVNLAYLAGAVAGKRKHERLSLRKVESLIGVSVSTLSRIENMKGVPDADIIQKLVDWLGIPISRVIGQETKAVTYYPNESLPSIVDAHLKQDKTLTAEARKSLSEIFTKAYELALLSSKGQQKGRKQ